LQNPYTLGPHTYSYTTRTTVLITA